AGHRAREPREPAEQTAPALLAHLLFEKLAVTLAREHVEKAVGRVLAESADAACVLEVEPGRLQRELRELLIQVAAGRADELVLLLLAVAAHEPAAGAGQRRAQVADPA